MTTIVLNQASQVTDFAAAKELIEEYAHALAVDLCFQNFAKELTSLSEMYGPPRGGLLLARAQQTPIGCVAIREHDQNSCEMKRLYVKPHFRGTSVGRQLAESAITLAKTLGYRRIVLDTLQRMHEARSLYASLGFEEIPGYYLNPLHGVQFMALDIGEP